MRFAYIDARGNEVRVPSEDALRLRIDLGAIGESTLLLDEERGGGWSAARDHDLYRRLRGDLERAAAPFLLPVDEIAPNREPPPQEWFDPSTGFDELEGWAALDLHVPDGYEARPSVSTPEHPHLLLEEAPAHGPGEGVDDPWTVPGRDPWAFDDADELHPAPPLAVDEPLAAPAFPEPPPPAEREWRPPRPHHRGVPPAPPRRRTRGVSVFGVVAALTVVAGALWWLVAPSAGDPPAVVLPDLAPTLQPVAAQAAAAAATSTTEALRTLPARDAIPTELDPDWLSGRYMANASEYTSVRLYWEAVGRYVQVMRAREGELFAAELGAALDTIALAADDRAAVTERSLAGFAASASDREAVHGQLRAVADAALRLHGFLEQNQARIDHEPVGAGLSRDPVLEAVPETEALGAEMWNRVADITSALDALGFLDKVTTERLLDVFFTKLGSVKVR